MSLIIYSPYIKCEKQNSRTEVITSKHVDFLGVYEA